MTKDFILNSIEKEFLKNTFDGQLAYIEVPFLEDKFPKNYFTIGKYEIDKDYFCGVVINKNTLNTFTYYIKGEQYIASNFVISSIHASLIFKNFEIWREQIGLNSVKFTLIYE